MVLDIGTHTDRPHPASITSRPSISLGPSFAFTITIFRALADACCFLPCLQCYRLTSFLPIRRVLFLSFASQPAMDDRRFRSQHSPTRNESPMNLNSIVSPTRNGPLLPGQVPAHDPRSNLPRRFTTDSGRVPTLSSIVPSPQRGPEPPQDYVSCFLDLIMCYFKMVHMNFANLDRSRPSIKSNWYVIASCPHFPDLMAQR